ncbi:hypothetical protein A4X06_0g8971 [Tilletia controversa]|uniref:Uncharacterized protein n=1 Tax=Tilletia controversa TaxID=13291 RepID=A0A8X7SSP0_9BASI|nr:hypothetical protein A4X06_0g8971 [Tilletia controversa]
MVSSAFLARALAAAATLISLAAAYPGVDPVNNRRGGHKYSSYNGTLSSRGTIPFTAPVTAGKSADSECTTNNCINGQCFPDDGGCTADNCPEVPTNTMRCKYDLDCEGKGRCGTSRDYSRLPSDGTSLQGRCLIAGGYPCTDRADCQSGTCQQNGNCALDQVLGYPAPNDYTCGAQFRQQSLRYVAATELLGGTFALSTKVYNLPYCGWRDAGNQCASNSDCSSRFCTDTLGDGVLRCGTGEDVGTTCFTNFVCQTGRYSYAKGAASSRPFCTFQPVGGPCSAPADCGSGKCNFGRTCGASDLAGACYYNSDCYSNRHGHVDRRYDHNGDFDADQYEHVQHYYSCHYYHHKHRDRDRHDNDNDNANNNSDDNKLVLDCHKHDLVFVEQHYHNDEHHNYHHVFVHDDLEADCHKHEHKYVDFDIDIEACHDVGHHHVFVHNEQVQYHHVSVFHHNVKVVHEFELDDDNNHTQGKHDFEGEHLVVCHDFEGHDQLGRDHFEHQRP